MYRDDLIFAKRLYSQITLLRGQSSWYNVLAILSAHELAELVEHLLLWVKEPPGYFSGYFPCVICVIVPKASMYYAYCYLVSNFVWTEATSRNY